MAKAKKTGLKKSAAGDKKKNATDVASKSLIVQPAITFVVLALFATVTLALLIPQRQAADLARQTDLYATQQAALVNEYVAQLQTRLEKLALKQQIRQAVKEKNTAAINVQSAELSNAFPLADGVQLIPLDADGITGLRKHGIKLRNNIEASLVNRVEDGEKAYPEAYPFRNTIHFSVVSPITENDGMEVSGAIIVRMNIDALLPALSQLSEDRGQFELLQKFTWKETFLLSGGDEIVSTLPERDIRVGESNWWIRFAPSNMVKQELAFPLWQLLALLSLPCVLIPLWHYLSLRSSFKRVHADLDTMEDYAQSLISGNKRMPPVFADKRFNPLADLIGSFRVSANAAQTAPSPAKKKANPPQPHTGIEVEEAAPEPPADIKVPENIFRAYDIRGDADKYLTDEVVHAIGMAIGSEALDRSQDRIVVACDGRVSSPRIKKALCDGLMASGQHILDIGELPTPLLYFATHHLETKAGVMITGSHNAANCNGLKLVLEGRPLSGEHIQTIRQRITDKNFHSGQGSIEDANVAEAYVDAIASDVAVAQTLKVVVDAGNGIGGVMGPRVLEELGCDVIELHCEVDGTFPNHGPDPTKPENLADLVAAVKQHEADFGIALDGDADRVCVVDSTGAAVAPDVLLMLFAQDIVSRNPGADIVYDVKCTRHLSNVISNYGGRPIMWKSGHSCIKEKMLQTGALLGGEFTGHICFKERWFGFDDGIYSAARLVEIVSTSGLKLEELIEEYPASKSTPEIIVDTGEQQKFEIVAALSDNAQFGAGKITTLDGIRVDYPDGWGLIRPSNTVSAITLRFEADNDEALERIQSVFREQVGLVNPSVAEAF